MRRCLIYLLAASIFCGCGTIYNRYANRDEYRPDCSPYGQPDMDRSCPNQNHFGENNRDEQLQIFEKPASPARSK